MTGGDCVSVIGNPGGRGMAAPPPGVTPNFDDPASHREELLALNVSLLTLSTIFVALRMYTRRHLTRRIGWDDVLAVFALIFSIMFAVAAMLGARYGWGIHCWDIDRVNRPAYLKSQIGITATYLVAIFLVKASILLFYIRIFDSSRLVLYSAWILFGVLAVFTLPAILLAIFACNPVQSYWRPEIKGKCIDSVFIGVISVGVSIITDVLIFVLPLRQIWKLHLPLRQRIQVIASLGAGLLACAVSVVRVVYFVNLATHFDVTWHTGPLMLWTVAEINVGIISGCLPTLKPLIRRYFPSWTESSSAAPSSFMQSSSSNRSRLKRYLPFGTPDHVRLPDDEGIELGLKTILTSQLVVPFHEYCDERYLADQR